MTSYYKAYAAEWRKIRLLPPNLQETLIAQLHGAAMAFSIIGEIRQAEKADDKKRKEGTA